MKTTIKILPILFFIIGCSTSQTIIKPRTIEITVPEIRESLPAELKEVPVEKLPEIEALFSSLPESTYISGVKLNEKKDTLASIKYFPKTGKIDLFIPETKVDTAIMDTTKFIKPAIPLSQKFGYAFMGILGLLIFLAAAYFLKKKYVK